MRSQTISPLNKFLIAPRSIWTRLLTALGLILLALGAAALDGLLARILAAGFWRPVLLPGVIIFYIWTVSPLVDRGQAEVVRRFRPIVQLDDAAFEALVSRYSVYSAWKETLALGIGAAVGVLLGSVGMQDPNAMWLRVYWIAANSLMCALLGWTIYGAMDSTRLTNALHNQPLCFDLFDLHPFEPVGRQSLLLALVFIGGLTLAMLFGLSASNIGAWQTWVIYLPMAVLPVLIFFMHMRGTHAVLAAEKRRLLGQVQSHIRSLTPALQQALAETRPYGELAAEYAAVSAYELRLQTARTWPYNTAMLRTLAFTVLLPLVGRLITLFLFE
jgi:hypothetical protein